MELIYLDELKKVVADFVEQFGCKSEMNTDFAYYPNEQIITWSIFMTEKSDRYFQKYVNKAFPDIEADSFLWSLLHEIGHHMTYNEWTEEKLDLLKATKADAELKAKKPETEKLGYYLYFTAEDEWHATTWAAEYMRENSEEVKNFWLKFVEVYNNFLLINKIDF